MRVRPVRRRRWGFLMQQWAENRNFHRFSSSSKSSSSTKTTKTAVQRMRDMMKHHQQDEKKENLSPSQEYSYSSSEKEENAWETLWKEGVTPWDLGKPTKALISELELSKLSLPSKSLIPGCGTGYDLISLARYLDDKNNQNEEDDDDDDNGDSQQQQQPKQKLVVGLDISMTSLQHAQRTVEESIKTDGPFQQQQTCIEIYNGDFFEPPSTWDLVYTTNKNNKSSSLSDDEDRDRPSSTTSCQFDFIFDYTFFCALPPTLRRQWGYQISQLLEPHDGRLLTFIFPYTYKESNNKSSKGPPYQVGFKDYYDVLDPHGLQLETPLPYANLDTSPKRHGQEVVGWWRHTQDKKNCRSK